MKRPIKIPVILLTNYEETKEAEKLGFKVPDPILKEFEMTFFAISFIEPILKIKFDEPIITRTFIHVFGESLSTSWTQEQILEECQKAGWYD